MQLKSTFIFAALLSALCSSCDSNKSDLLQLVAERDSLRATCTQQAAQLDNYSQTIETLNTTLDAINEQEQMLFRGVDGMPISKEDFKYNLSRFDALLKQQDKKIKNLENRLAANADSSQQALLLIARLKAQVEEKNRQISELQEKVEQKDFNIRELQGQLENRNETIRTQERTIKRQDDALARQDSILNNGYYLIGSKEDLKRKGVLNKKGVLNADAILDRSKFAQVDIRSWRELTISAKKVAIVSNMPQSSYEVTTNGKHEFKLHILDATRFWSVSNYLIIMTD